MRLRPSLQASRMLYARGRNPMLQESTHVGHLLLPWHLLSLTRIVAQYPWLGKTDDGNLKRVSSGNGNLCTLRVCLHSFKPGNSSLSWLPKWAEMTFHNPSIRLP